MFVLTDMKDTVRICPWNFHLKLEDAIVDALNKKFANKVCAKLVENIRFVTVFAHPLFVLLP